MSAKTMFKATAIILTSYATGTALSHGINLALRKNQVYRKNIQLKKQNWKLRKFTIHKHNAKRRGLHIDTRIEYKGRALSFVNDTGLPKKVGEKVNLFRTIDHKMEYMDFEGTIPDGKFGAGTVKILQKGDCYTKINTSGNITTMKIMIPEGKYKGMYSLAELTDTGYIAYKHEIPKHIMKDRMTYKLIDIISASASELLKSKDYIAEEKMDGAYTTIHIGKHGTSITGRRADINNKPIEYTWKLPYLAEVKSKKYDGTILNGEIYHNKGPNMLTRILNSNYDKSMLLQEKEGFCDLYPFDIRKTSIKKLVIDGKEIDIKTYAGKRELMNNLIKELNNEHIKQVKTNSTSKLGFLQKVIQRKGEGIVLKHKTDKSLPWIKLVKTATHDMKIIRFTEGQGRLKDKAIGALIVSDKSGKIQVNVGTGLSDTLRKEIYANKEGYLNKIVKIEARKITDKSLIAPRFKGFHIGKNNPDKII